MDMISTHRRSLWTLCQLILVVIVILTPMATGPRFVGATPAIQNGNCWCTDYIYQRFLLEGAYGNANTWGSYLISNGFSIANTVRPGQIVVFSENAGLGPAGHVGVVVQADPLIVRGANQGVYSSGDAGPFSEFGCNNVYTTQYGPTARRNAKFYERPTGYKLSNQLSLSNTAPRVGETVTASFTLRNVGTSPLQIQDLAAGARQGHNWSGRWFDFPHTGEITLQPGEEYQYKRSQQFTITGDYFAEPVIKVNNNWGGMQGANRVTFSVRR